MSLDPEYARIYTKARIIAWQYGFSLVLHGSGTRDLDLLMVPWEDRATNSMIERVVRRIAHVCGLKLASETAGVKPHGRQAWTLLLPEFEDPRWVDLSVMPGREPAA